MAPKEAIEKINALGIEIGVASTGSGDDYISLTDIARYKSDEPKMVVQNWMRNRNTIEFLGVWESLHNPDFKGIEFDAFREEAGLNSFTLTPTKWISRTNAIGIRTKRGGMRAARSPTRTSHSSSLRGFPRNLSYTSSRTTSA